MMILTYMANQPLLSLASWYFSPAGLEDGRQEDQTFCTLVLAISAVQLHALDEGCMLWEQSISYSYSSSLSTAVVRKRSSH